MLLLLLVACQYSLHNNIVIMWVMYKQTRNTARCRHMVRYICTVMCTVNLMHVICTGACSHSCIRSVHFRSMQWTPLLVQSKRASTQNDVWATPQSAGLGRTGTGTSACGCDHIYPACYAARRTCCSNAAWVVWDVLHCPRTLCQQLFPYSTGWTRSAVHDN